MKKFFTELLWVCLFAWRDGRRSGKALVLVSAAVVIGVSALVALRSFKTNLETAITENSKQLLGADVLISSRRPISDESKAAIAKFPGEHSQEFSFASMAVFPKASGSRLVQVDALQGGYPFYGGFETTPPEAAETFRSGTRALIDRSLSLQFGTGVGDIVKVGKVDFTVHGILDRVPGVIDARNVVAPRIYIPLETLPQTELIQKGSRVNYKHYFKITDRSLLEEALFRYRAALKNDGLRVETVEDRQESVGKVLDKAYLFLDLIGFIALILGGIGVGSAARVYIRRKTRSVSVLRCLGARTWQTTAAFILQILSVGTLSTIIGAALGIMIQTLLPEIMRDFIPLEVEFFIAWEAVLTGAAMSLVMLFLFSLAPLASIRLIPPLAVLRVSLAENEQSDPVRQLIWALIVAASALFAMLHGGNVKAGLGFAVTVFAAAGILALFGRILRGAVRRYLPETAPYVVRQGLANLYRPFNQTVSLMVSVGMSVFLVITIAFSQSTVLAKAKVSAEEDRPNMIFFDIQTDQLSDLLNLLEGEGAKVSETVPMVSMRLKSVRGKSIGELRNEPDSEIPGWVLTREYRSTYRETLTEAEELKAGSFVASVEPGAEPVPISVEERIVDDLKLSLGDELVFDVQGVPLITVVSSIRKVDWQSLRPNFFVVFPSGVLEEAPQFHIVAARTATEEAGVLLQQKSVGSFPNISIIDFSLILRTLDNVLARLTSVVRFMGWFSVATAGVVLIAAIISGRRQRVRENVLLKTIGASRKDVLAVTAWEYISLGLFASTGGAILAALSGWVFAKFVFESPFVASFVPALGTAAAAVILIAVLGVLGSFGTYQRPAIEVLRQEE